LKEIIPLMNLLAEHLVSIVTVCLNDRAGLEKTVCSVISQQNIKFEYIVVDGGSNDGSVDIIKEYGHNLAAWLSEPDKGPYDAMNKGIRLATGEWIIFLNAGDVFFDRESLSGMSRFLSNTNIDAIYGDSLADYRDFRIYRKAGPFRDIWKGMIFSHQALLLRLSLVKEKGFNTRFPKIADYDLILRSLPDPARVAYQPVPLAICDAYGISASGQAAVLRDYYHCSRDHYKMDLSRKFYFLRTYIFLNIIDITKKILPGKTYYTITGLIRKKPRTS
jgi:glycosyltransferase involved in cell wall biosynthesis